MLNQADLTGLLNIDGHSDSPILTIYINVDQSNMSNLNRGFETALKNLLNECERRLPDASKKDFRDDAKTVLDFIANYTPQKKTLVLFCDASTGFFLERSLRVPLQNQCYWERRPHVRPLIEAQDEYERYGLILTDRAHSRLFTIAFGEIEENKVALASDDVKRFEAAGSDHLLSQSTFQRNADEHAKAHLKHVAAMMELLFAEQRFDRLILAGPKGTVSQLQELLSQPLQKRVIGMLSLPMLAKDSEVLEAANRLVAEFERDEESNTVERLITAAAKHQQAVVGLSSTVEAAVEGRIMALVYADDFRANNGEWEAGKETYDAIQDLSPVNANTNVESPVDLLEWLVAHVARQGGHVEQVKDGAAAELQKNARGIGAFLRF